MNIEGQIYTQCQARAVLLLVSESASMKELRRLASASLAAVYTDTRMVQIELMVGVGGTRKLAPTIRALHHLWRVKKTALGKRQRDPHCCRHHQSGFKMEMAQRQAKPTTLACV